MAEEKTVERVLWKGHGIATVIERKRTGRGIKFKLRDAFGFIVDDVPNKEIERLSADDERAQFTVKSD